MSDRMWSFISFFFTITIIVGGLTAAYFGERGQLGIIMDNVIMRTALILYCLIGVFIIVLSEVRKRVDGGTNGRSIGITIILLLIIGGFLALTRL